MSRSPYHMFWRCLYTCTEAVIFRAINVAKPCSYKCLAVSTLRKYSSTNFSQYINPQMKALVFLAPGAEEIEVVCPVDVLRRGGVKVTIAGVLDGSPVKCSRNVVIVPDVSIEDALSMAPFDALILPGGMNGSKNLAESEKVGELLREQESANRIIATICAASTALKAHNIAVGKTVTSYPTVENVLTEGGKYTYSQDEVVVDGKLITSRAPGTALKWSLTILESLAGKDKALEIAQGMLVSY